MKRRILIAAWCTVPVLLLAYHYGPGQQGSARDRAARHLAEAQTARALGNWSGALALYSRALDALPAADKQLRWPILLARAESRMFTGELPEAMIEMESLLSDLQKAAAPSRLIEQARARAATAQYYAAWLMRLEGATHEEWMPEVEQARQNFRLLAEQAQQIGASTEALSYQKNLESAIRLARMDLSELQALPLPKQCEGCKNCSQKCRSQRESMARKQGEKQPKDARGATAGKRPDGTGS